MKKLDYYMDMPYCFVVIPDINDGGYTIYYPDLKGCITCGNFLDEAIKNAQEAKEEWLKACIEDGINIPQPSFLQNGGDCR